MDHKEKIKNLPDSPGVYIMKDSSGAVLYVGKAKELKKRVQSYFRSSGPHSDRIAAMLRLVEDITYIPASTEAEALIYENSLIKQLSPRYNVALRDDKSYPLLKLTVKEEYPRLILTREKKDDGNLYYGPFTSATLLRQALVLLRQMFPIRTCSKLGKKPCLQYHIKQCVGPCAGKIDRGRYMEIIDELKLFLDGRRQELVKVLTKKMLEASKAEEFEEAGRIKRMIEAVGSLRERRVEYNAAGEAAELAAILGAGKGRLDRIEAFDISNIMGASATGSMVSFRNGVPDKNRYRRFRIKTVGGMDDYAMMREIVRRRYSRVLAERDILPDLVLIDGGKGHLAAACEELALLGLGRLPVAAIAKEFEHLYIKGLKDAVVLPRDSKALHLLERIRDEAHRFAISYHKKLSSKRMLGLR